MRNFLLITAIVLTITVGLSTVGDHESGTSSQHRLPHADVATVDHHHYFSQQHPYTGQDLVALEDMHGYATAHFGPCEPVADSFGMTDAWDSEWVYRQVRFQTAGGTSVRICQATSRHDHDARYVTAWDELHGRYQHWQQVH